jgi:hypothetical protein
MKEGHVMTARKNTAANFPVGRKSAASPASGAPASASRKRRLAGAAVLGIAALAAAGALAGGAGRADAAVLTNCAPTPGTCNYPTAATTGVPAGTTLKQVPSQVTSGPGWTWNATTNTAVVSTDGTVLSGLSISGTLQVNADNVTVKNVKVTSGGNFGISLTHTAGVTISNSTVSGLNTTTGRVGYAIDDVYGDSTGMTLKANNISNFRTAVQISTGLADGNYIYEPGFLAGDHTNGFYVGGGTQPLTIQNNTIFDPLSQTDAINLDAPAPGPGAPVANKTIKNNLLAGGSYTIYAGAAGGSPTSNIVITGNRFGQNYFPKSGQYGPVAYFDRAGTGNTWSGNIWDTTGQAVSSS